MTGLTALGMLVVDKVSSGATELDRKMAFNYILGVVVGALSVKYPDAEATTEGKSPSAPLKDKGEEKPKRKYTRRAKAEGKSPSVPLKNKGEAKPKRKYTRRAKAEGKSPRPLKNKGEKKPTGRTIKSAAEADAYIREQERQAREKHTGANP